MITIIPTLFVLYGMEEKAIQCMHVNSVGKDQFIMSENITEKIHRAVLHVVKLDKMEDFPWAEVLREPPFAGK